MYLRNRTVKMEINIDKSKVATINKTKTTNDGKLDMEITKRRQKNSNYKSCDK